MSNQEDRVLCRRGARELTRDEAEVVDGAFSNTSICSFIRFNSLTQTHTGADCDNSPGDTDTDL
jgi:hypothetical protein